MTPEERFIENMPLVYWYLSRYQSDKVADEDYKQIGFLGLWRACLAYNESMKYKFSTFAIVCIANEIRKCNKYTYEKVHRLESSIHLDSPPINENGDPSTDYNEFLLDEESGYSLVELKSIIDKVIPEGKKNYQKRRRQVVDMLLDGYSQVEISKELNITRQRVGNIVKKVREDLIKEYNR